MKEYAGHINSAVTGDDLENDPIGHERADQKQTEGGVSIRGTIMRMFTYKPMKYTDSPGVVRYFGVTAVKLDESQQRMHKVVIHLAIIGDADGNQAGRIRLFNRNSHVVMIIVMFMRC